MKYIFTNVLGSYVFNEGLKTIDFIPFKLAQEYEQKNAAEQKLKKKHPDSQPLPPEKLTQVLSSFHDPKYYSALYQYNLYLTKKAIKAAVSEDQLIIQTIANVTELDRSSNLLTKRLREWNSLQLPELSENIHSHEKFTESVADKKKEQLLKELNISAAESMGAELRLVDIEEIQQLAKAIRELQRLRLHHEQYLEQIMRTYCPNFMELAGVMVGAKLLELAKSLKHLALLPASTIQLLGAEKALFRHIKTGARSPKYGILYQHPLIQNCKPSLRGKAARTLADKLSLCARLDYFKGEFKAKEYRKELESRFG